MTAFASNPSLTSADRSSQQHAQVGLSIEALKVQFDGRQPVLKELNLEVEPGQIVALVGASGCGKSTLLRTIAGLQAYQSGAIHYTHGGGNQVDCAFVFQDATLLPWRSVYENVRLPFELKRYRSLKLTAAQIQERIVQSLQAVSLDQQQWNLFPRQLSGGMRMRTSIARALVTDPSLLLLDEPFAALDDILRTRLNQLLLDLWNSKHRTILFVTHNISEAVMLSHKIAVVAHGQIAKLIDNTLPWPRDVQQRTSVAFAQMFSEVGQALAQTSSDTTDEKVEQ